MNKKITTTRQDLITRLGYLRSRADLSARELSLRLGFSSAYMAKYENGDFNMSSEKLIEAITICGATPEEFFHKDINNYKEDKELLTAYHSLSEESKQTIKALIKNMK